MLAAPRRRDSLIVGVNNSRDDRLDAIKWTSLTMDGDMFCPRKYQPYPVLLREKKLPDE